LIPYTIGIIGAFLGSGIHEIDKRLFGMPEDYVLNSEKKKSVGKIKFGSSLGKGLAQKIQKIAVSKFGSELSSGSLYFNVHYSLQFAPFPRIQSHIARITNLMNLHEGLIPSIIFGTLFAFIASNQLHIAELKIIGLIIIGDGHWTLESLPLFERNTNQARLQIFSFVANNRQRRRIATKGRMLIVVGGAVARPPPVPNRI